jgi:uncharacterized protein YjcR
MSTPAPQPIAFYADRESMREMLRELLREELPQGDVLHLSEPVYSVARLAEMFGVSKKTIQKWYRTNLLEYTAVTSRDRVSTPEQIRAFLKKKRPSLKVN